MKRRALDVGFTKSQAVLAWQAFKQMTPHEQQQVQLDVVRWLKRFKVELREREMAERWERILARYGR